MKTHVKVSYDVFKDGCARAYGLKLIFDYLKRTAPPALNCDDILRSFLVLAVSSFDLFIHDLFRKEVVYRLSRKQEISGLKVPFNLMIADPSTQNSMLDEYIREQNAYKSFVAPEKLKDCLNTLIDNFWGKISLLIDEPPLVCKARLKSISDLRNRIAHEADVNPTFSGIELWPIYSEDVESSIAFLRLLGQGVADVTDKS